MLVFAAHSTNFAELKEAYVNITLNTSTTREITEVIVENVTIEEKEEGKRTGRVQQEEKREGKTGAAHSAGLARSGGCGKRPDA